MKCPVDECPKDTHRGGYCYAHYMKNWRYGTPTPTHRYRRSENLLGQRIGHLLVLGYETEGWWVCMCDCGEVVTRQAGTLNRDRRDGVPSSCGSKELHGRRDDISYGSAHCRVRSDRGPASDHACVDCQGPARQWSYAHGDPDELVENGLRYSVRPEHYEPRCISCHMLLDLSVRPMQRRSRTVRA